MHKLSLQLLPQKIEGFRVPIAFQQSCSSELVPLSSSLTCYIWQAPQTYFMSLILNTLHAYILGSSFLSWNLLFTGSSPWHSLSLSIQIHPLLECACQISLFVIMLNPSQACIHVLLSLPCKQSRFYLLFQLLFLFFYLLCLCSLSVYSQGCAKHSCTHL